MTEHACYVNIVTKGTGTDVLNAINWSYLSIKATEVLLNTFLIHLMLVPKVQSLSASSPFVKPFSHEYMFLNSVSGCKLLALYNQSINFLQHKIEPRSQHSTAR